jgi:nitrogen fixation protein NifU and related proteins
MTGDVLGLYQQIILDHYRNPRNLRPFADGARHAVGNNPLCGDRITVYVRLSETGHILTDATFEGAGCAICIASASLMTEIVRDKTVAENDRLGQRVHDLVTAAAEAPIDDLNGLVALAGVRQFPVRMKCALLPWHTLHAAVHELDTIVSTE